ncbi:MAG: peptidase M28, partial [Sphingomonas bacterium]
MRKLFPLAALLIATPAAAKDAPDPARLRATVEKLVSFGTRHSLSSADDSGRGIGAARSWVAGELTRIS